MAEVGEDGNSFVVVGPTAKKKRIDRSIQEVVPRFELDRVVEKYECQMRAMREEMARMASIISRLSPGEASLDINGGSDEGTMEEADAPPAQPGLSTMPVLPELMMASAPPAPPNPNKRSPAKEATNNRTEKLPPADKRPRNTGLKGKGNKVMPAISVYGTELRELVGIIDRSLGHRSYTVKVVNRTTFSVRLESLDDYVRVRDLMVERKYSFHTHTPKVLNPHSMVIEGLSSSYEEQEVRDFLLKETGLRLELVGINKLSNDKWLVRLTKASDIVGFCGLRVVLRCRVGIRRSKGRQPLQCYNCQRFGHAARDCGMPYRCVKCGQPHGPGKCVIPPKGASTASGATSGPSAEVVKRPLRCANCDRIGHAASAPDCPRRLAFMARKTGGRVAAAPNRGRVRPGLSYAAAASAATTPRDQGVPPVRPTGGRDLGGAMVHASVMFADCKRFFGKSFLQCMGRIEGFGREYRALTNDEERSMAMIGLMLQLRFDD